MSDPYEICAGCFSKQGEIDKLKASLVAIKDKCAKTIEIDMGSYESVPVGFTRAIYEMALTPLSGMEVSTTDESHE